MSNSNPTLSVLGIPDSNIEVLGVYDEYRGKGTRRKKFHVISAVLSYHLTHCPDCAQETLRPNGHYIARIRVLNGTDIPTVIDLRKQRWLCTNCNHTISAKTALVKANHTLASNMTPYIMKLSKEGIPVKTIARIVGVSPTSVTRTITGNLKLRPARVLPANLCFDEFRSTNNMMSFICIDAVSHELVSLLGDRLNKTIKDFFIGQYSLQERLAVETVTMDMNAAYQSFIHEVFPNAKIVIDRFHIIQLIGRAMDQVRIQALKRVTDHHSRVYRVMKPNWRLFHKVAPNATDKRYLFGLNEYVTEQEAIDIALDFSAELKRAYELYLEIHDDLIGETKSAERLAQLLDDYQNDGSPMDTVIATLRTNRTGILEAVSSPFSNGPIEGVNRRIKALKRGSFGFRNQLNFFLRIYQLIA